MFKRFTVLAAALVVMFGMANTASAQTELGMDAGFLYRSQMDFNDVEQPTVTAIQVPAMLFRAGFFVSPNISIEPGLGFLWWQVGDDGGSEMELQLTADALYHFQSSGSSQFFVHVGGALTYVSEKDSGAGAESFTGSQFGFGGGAGVKLPLADAVKFRIGARYHYMLESESTDGISFPGAHNFLVTFGLSVFLGG